MGGAARRDTRREYLPMEELIRYAAEGVHEKVLEYMEGLHRGTVLDIPSGQGALSKGLEQMGFYAVLGDIARDNMLYRHGRCVQLDLHDPLPFRNKTFHYVTCIEGIEHIENPHHLIREFSRIIKKDGFLVITTPNIMTIKSRLRFLFYSYLDFFRYFGPVPTHERHQINEYDHQHLNPVLLGELKFILEKYGFKIDWLETNRKVRRWKVIFPLLKWYIKRKTKKKYQGDPLYISDIILEGEILIFGARRSDCQDLHLSSRGQNG
jgi:2-polyprenyl-3-methyl-5-hydroxy-6-metoxy-1,4-benzoquinol methylase